MGSGSWPGICGALRRATTARRGVPRSSDNAHETANAVDHVDDRGDVSRGATAGALIGGAGGLLAGLGLLAIPGLGPVVAAGWLLAAATGADIGAAGGASTG